MAQAAFAAASALSLQTPDRFRVEARIRHRRCHPRPVSDSDSIRTLVAREQALHSVHYGGHLCEVEVETERTDTLGEEHHTIIARSTNWEELRSETGI